MVVYAYSSANVRFLNVIPDFGSSNYAIPHIHSSRQILFLNLIPQIRHCEESSIPQLRQYWRREEWENIRTRSRNVRLLFGGSAPKKSSFFDQKSSYQNFDAIFGFSTFERHYKPIYSKIRCDLDVG